MSIGKFIRFLRRGRQLNGHVSQPLYPGSNQQSNSKIIEYQDRWTLSPSRPQIWCSSNSNRGIHSYW